jgi:hypothetical protein
MTMIFESILPKKSCVWLSLWALACVLTSGQAEAATLVSDDFTSDSTGWTGSGLSVSHTNAGFLVGSFAADALPGAIGASSDFTGDITYGGSLLSLSFSFQSVDVLPSGFGVIFGSGANVFSYYAVNPTTVGSWETLEVPMTYSANWLGGDENAFNSALGSVDFFEIEIAPGFSGISQPAQTYYLDNFTFSSAGVTSTAIPEPGLSILMVLGTGVLFLLRQRALRYQVASGFETWVFAEPQTFSESLRSRERKPAQRGGIGLIWPLR